MPFHSLEHGNFSKEENRDTKAVKADDAKVPAYIWNHKAISDYSPEKHERHLEVIREQIGFRWYKRELWRSFRKYMQKQHEDLWWSTLFAVRSKRLPLLSEHRDLLRDIKVGVDALTRAVSATWWE